MQEGGKRRERGVVGEARELAEPLVAQVLLDGVGQVALARLATGLHDLGDALVRIKGHGLGCDAARRRGGGGGNSGDGGAAAASTHAGLGGLGEPFARGERLERRAGVHVAHELAKHVGDAVNHDESHAGAHFPSPFTRRHDTTL
ncbi:MAG: hypothetical protein ACKVI4_14860 [Actinomycetales bacterium]